MTIDASVLLKLRMWVLWLPQSLVWLLWWLPWLWMMLLMLLLMLLRRRAYDKHGQCHHYPWLLSMPMVEGRLFQTARSVDGRRRVPFVAAAALPVLRPLRGLTLT